MSTDTYERDFYRWTQQQAALIRKGRLEALDLEHIAEELEDMGISSKRELVNRLGVLLAHLLKWRYPLRKPLSRSLPVHPGTGFGRRVLAGLSGV